MVSPEKWLDQSRWRLGCGFVWAQGSVRVCVCVLHAAIVSKLLHG